MLNKSRSNEVPNTECTAEAGQDTLVRRDLVDAIYQASNVTRAEAQQILSAVLDVVVDTVARGEEFKLHGFGKFKILDKKARIGRNPRTGEEAMISARRTISFQPSPNLIATLNRK